MVKRFKIISSIKIYYNHIEHTKTILKYFHSINITEYWLNQVIKSVWSNATKRATNREGGILDTRHLVSGGWGNRSNFILFPEFILEKLFSNTVYKQKEILLRTLLWNNDWIWKINISINYVMKNSQG